MLIKEMLSHHDVARLIERRNKDREIYLKPVGERSHQAKCRMVVQENGFGRASRTGRQENVLHT